MHLSHRFGNTVRAIEEDGFTIADRVEMQLCSDTPEGIASSMGRGTISYAESYARVTPDILVVLGDRFEMHAAALAALPFNIPVAHIHGGESTEGAIDEALRHSITKMSHLHFTSTEVYAQRVIQMGEEPWRVTVSGAPGLDNLNSIRLLTRQELSERFSLALDGATLVATYHPVTLEYRDTKAHLVEFLGALSQVDQSIIFTSPNSDTGNQVVLEGIKEFADQRQNVQITANLGTQGYFSLMSHASAMVGNSSSGIIEAASFELPVVNVGDRQRGRIHSENVIDVGINRQEILGGLSTALSPGFRAGLAGIQNPYGDGFATERIVSRLSSVSIDDRLIKKRFYDLARSGSPAENPL
jgi:UDP-hydrolysing UDP-N-acetyl-D-glucosamine 2-epimerase